MLVFYDDTGAVTGSFEGERALLAPDALAVEADMTPAELGELSDWRVVDGELVRSSMKGAIRDGLAAINASIGTTRLGFITDIPGQQMIYANKETEARAYLALASEPDTLADFPFIAAECQATGLDAYLVAQIFINLAAQWRSIGAGLEGLRIAYGDAVKAAKTPEEIPAIVAALQTALEPYQRT
jgi:hypothetical protein